MKLNTLERVCLIFVIIGSLNWGLVGLFELDIVAGLLGGPTSILSKVVYVLMGFCALFLVFRLPSLLKPQNLDTRNGEI